MGGRFRRGWDLAKQSWAILRADRALALFPVVAAVACLVAGILIIGPGAALFATVSKPAGVVVMVIGGYVLTFIGIYCSTALAAAAAKALDGGHATLGDGFAAVRSRRGVIAQWALVQLTVGLLLQVIQGLLSESAVGRLVATIFTSLAGAAWAIATFFVLPILALEGVGPKEAFTRSAHTIRERWGEGLIGAGSIGGLVFLCAMLPAIGLGVLGVVVASSTPAAGVALLAIAVIVFVGAAILSSTLNVIFRVALYRFATEQRVVGGFDGDALAGAFQPKKRGRRQPAV
ncbi:MAG TPA: DUF6159 family protein [Conexibacter sp.]|jgi:hypothetical protein|nr:DUF6159 family protein [Conexibacter sp.]